MRQLFLSIFLFLVLIPDSNSQIKKIIIYHFSFYDEFPFSGGPHEESIKKLAGTRKYCSKKKDFLKATQLYIDRLDTLKNFKVAKEANNVQLLVEIKYKGGTTERIYSWANKEVFYKNKLFEADPTFVKLIEQYFPTEISWSNVDVDHKN